jgi:ribosome-dependent ATPase
MVNFLLMSLLAVTVFGVPVKGSFATWRWPRCLLLRRHGHGAAGLGRHAQPDRGHVLRHDRHHHPGHPVRRPDRSGVLARRGGRKWIGEIYPATHMISISRGVFSKALGLADLTGPLWPMLCRCRSSRRRDRALLKKQER